MKSKLTYALTISLATAATSQAAEDHLVFEPKGTANGKHVVLLAGDEEYRSEESMPLMGQILANQGFKTTVLFSLTDGIVDPENVNSLSNSVALDSADAIVMCIRFRHWDDESMTRFDNALNRGVPIVALRTSTHAFNIKDQSSKWAKYSWNAKADAGWEKGFGRQVLGESWVRHHGKHKKEGTRTIVEKGQEKNPILNSVNTIFSTTDVYAVKLLEPSTVLLRGEVTKSLDPDSEGIKGKKNKPMMPVVWTREFDNEGDKDNRILTITLGTASDFVHESFRRLVSNGVYWGLEMDVPAKADVTMPGDFKPTKYSYGIFKKNMKPADFIVK